MTTKITPRNHLDGFAARFGKLPKFAPCPECGELCPREEVKITGMCAECARSYTPPQHKGGTK